MKPTTQINNSPKAFLVEHQKRQEELEKLRSLNETTSAWLAQQERTADLADKSALAEISRLQVMCKLLPNRIADREEALALFEDELFELCRRHVSLELGPRCRALLDQTRQSVRRELSSHISDSLELDQAVEASSAVREIVSVEFSVTVKLEHLRGAAGYAADLFEAEKQIAALERKFVAPATPPAPERLEQKRAASATP